jgi:hypothetical protein
MTKQFLIIAIIAAAFSFASCNKEEKADQKVGQKDTTTQKYQEKIEYMDIPCVDFSRIKKETNPSKGAAPILQFESWEHYATVVDAMLEFSYDYIAKRVEHVRDSIPGIDDDDLSLILHNQGIYQFMPLYSFVKQLQFENSAFPALRTEEIKWMNSSESSRKNPFDEMSMGYIQSALHNSEGNVLIGNEIFNPSIGLGAKGCRTNERWDNSSTGNGGTWPTYNYNSKKREFRAFLHSQQSYTYSKTSMYYFNAQNNRIVWLCNLSMGLSGYRYNGCEGDAHAIITINKSGKVFASVQEKYDWYSTYPNYLWGGAPKQSVNSGHHAPSKSYYVAL